MNQSAASSQESKPTEPRLTATIVRIKDILDGSYVTQEGWDPNYVKSLWGAPIYRVHLVGTIIEKQGQQLVLDDGESSINLQSFEPIPNVESIDVGSIVRVIGRPRVFNEQMYVYPEILVKLDAPELVRLHKAYLDFFAQQRSVAAPLPKTEDVQVDEIEDEQTGEGELIDIIDALDKGDGVDVEVLYEQLLKKKKAEHPERVVERLLLHGDIFEIQPGKVKVLR